MPDRHQIANIALTRLGSDAIQSFDDGTSASDACSLYYEPAVRAVLQAHPWRFAGKVGSLSQDTTAAHPGYDYSYQLPTDCVQVRALLDSDGDRASDPYGLFGLKVCTDLEAPAYAEYTYRAPEQYFTADFVLCLARLLEHYLAGTLTEDRAKSADAFQAYSMELARAASRDSQQDTPQNISSDDLVNWHRGG